MTITYIRTHGEHNAVSIQTADAEQLRKALQVIDAHHEAKAARLKVHVVSSLSEVFDKIFGDTRPTTDNDETGEDARDIPADDGANLCDKQSVYLSLANDEGGGFVFGDIEDHTGASKVFGEDVAPHDGEDRRIRIGPDHFNVPGTVQNIASHEYNAGVLAIMLCRDIVNMSASINDYITSFVERARSIVDCYDNPGSPRASRHTARVPAYRLRPDVGPEPE